MRDDAAGMEFEALRNEVNNRTTLAYALLGLELTAVGGGFVAGGSFTLIPLVLAVVSTFLWLFWCDLVEPIHRIAAYIAIDLGPRLGDESRTAMRWESFWRRVEGGGPAANAALYPGRRPPPRAPRLHKGTSADWYVALLLGGAPVLLVAAYVAGYGDLERLAWSDVPSLLCVIGACGLWLFAIFRFRRFRQTLTAIHVAILASNSEEEINSATRDEPSRKAQAARSKIES